MPYKDRLERWVVVRLLPNMQRITVARCVRESDADGYVQIMRRLVPEAQFVLMFEPESD